MDAQPTPRATSVAPARFPVRPFTAPRWLRGAHAQTIGGKLFRGEPALPLRRERIDTPDGDFVDLDFTTGGDPAAPLVLVLHGLEGSARRRYMLQTYEALRLHDVAAVGLNFRSCSGEPNRTARFYHSGETDDLRFVLKLLAARFPGRPLGLLGFSLGGNVLLKLLGEDGDAARERIGAAVAVSVPYDLAAGATMLERWPMGRFYSWYFLRMLRPKVAALGGHLESRCDLEGVKRARTLREFDEAFTAPLHGFAGAADYYARSSSAQYLSRVRVPTLLLHAEDDPFLPAAALPRAAAGANPWISTGFAADGGHVGFIHGSPRRPRFWAEEEGARFLAYHLTARDPRVTPAAGC